MSIARYIDHAVLHPTQNEHHLRAACRMGRELQVATVCVKPYMIPLAAELLDGSPVGVSTVVGFPHGSISTDSKAAEAEWACRHGARELDMVANVGLVVQESWDRVAADIRAVVSTGKKHRVPTKVILETGMLPSDELKVRLCRISCDAGAAMVKTSTGFGFVKQPGGGMEATGATEHDVQLLRATCPEHVGVKASGGIRCYADAQRMIELGASRLGTSATETIVQQEKKEQADVPPDGNS